MDGHLVNIILSQGYVDLNGRMVMHLKGLDCSKMFSSADGKFQQLRCQQLNSNRFNASSYQIHIFNKWSGLKVFFRIFIGVF